MSNKIVNEGDFFVMLNKPDGGFTQLELCTSIQNGTSELSKFKTKEEAEKGAVESVLGGTFGFEVFELGNGC